MVERDTSVLIRVAAFVVLAAAVVTWDAVAPHLGAVGLWPSVTIVAAAVMPATLGLIYLALPLWSWRWIPVAAAVFGLVAVLTWKAGQSQYACLRASKPQAEPAALLARARFSRVSRSSSRSSLIVSSSAALRCSNSSSRSRTSSEKRRICSTCSGSAS